MSRGFIARSVSLVATISGLACTTCPQDPLEQLRNADWRERARLARAFVEDPDFDVNPLLLALRSVSRPRRGAVGIGNNWPYPDRAISQRSDTPYSRRLYDSPSYLLRRPSDLVIHMSAEDAAMQIVALRSGERDDAVLDAIIDALVDRPLPALQQFASRRPQRALTRLLEHPGLRDDPALLVRLVSTLGAAGEAQLTLWLDDPRYELFALDRLARIECEPTRAGRIAAFIGGPTASFESASTAVSCLRGHLSADAAQAVVDVIAESIASPDAWTRARSAAALAWLDLDVVTHPELQPELASLLDAGTPHERGCAAAALGKIGERVQLAPQVIRQLLSLASAPGPEDGRELAQVRIASRRALLALGRSPANRTSIVALGDEIAGQIGTTRSVVGRRQLIESLGRLGPNGASPGTLGVLESLLGGSDPSAASASAVALMHIGPTAAASLPSIVERLGSTRSVPRRRELILAACAVAPREGAALVPGEAIDIDDLIEALSSGMDFEQHRSQLRTLLESRCNSVRLAAAITLLSSHRRDEDLHPYLPALVADPDPRIRRLAQDLAFQQMQLGANLKSLQCAATDRLATTTSTDARTRQDLALFALSCGVIRSDALGAVLSVIAQVPDRGGPEASPSPYPELLTDPPVPLGKTDFMIAIRNLPNHPAAIAFLETWMDSSDPDLREAAAYARLVMEWR